MDVTKSFALLAGRCAAVLVRGEPSQLVEMDVQKWLGSELFQAGIELDPTSEAQERKDLGYLKTLDAPASAATAPVAGPPGLRRQASYVGVDMTSLAAQVAVVMKDCKVSVPFFPVYV
jgi:hypothetical protein